MHTAAYDKYRVSLHELSEAQLNNLQLPQRYLMMRKVVEILFILLGAPLVLPIVILTALAIKFESRGPVLFVQERPGKNGRFFKMYKFRSMKNGIHTNLTAKKDSRITKVGSFIRKYRIDELPQLWNVLTGDMSLIGPRPEPSFISADLEKHIPYYNYRRVVRPGITGLAQVQLGYTETIESTRTKLEHDLYYLFHLSWMIDVYILYKTLWVTLRGAGAQ